MENKVMKIATLAIILLLLVSNKTKKVYGITCPEAIALLNPCVGFLTGINSFPTGPCCLAVQKVNEEASTTVIRRELCSCFKQVGPSLGVKPEKAKQLPELCHVQTPIPIDPSVDCSKIK